MNKVSKVRITALPQQPAGLASWYMPGLVDGFGDRLLMFDNTDSDALELLRFHSAIAAAPGFEEALRDRVRRVSRLPHAVFPPVRAVEHLDSDGSLALVSAYTPGKRLSGFFAEPRLRNVVHPGFVTWVVSQVLQPLSVLQSEGDDVTHSVLTADRVILTPDGQVRVAEHVLGDALRRLGFSPWRLWREFGILVPTDAGGAARLNAQADVFQLGVLALSLLLARRLTPSDIQDRLPSLLDDWSATVTGPLSPFGDPLRGWLERALGIANPYASAREAYADLRELPSKSIEFLEAGEAKGLADLLVLLQSNGSATEEEAHMATDSPFDGGHASEPTGPNGTASIPPQPDTADQTDAFPMALKPPFGDSLSSIADDEAEESLSPPDAPRVSAGVLNLRGPVSWIAMALVAVVLLQGVAIAVLWMRTWSAPVPTAATVTTPVPTTETAAPAITPVALSIPEVTAKAGAAGDPANQADAAQADAALEVRRRNAEAAAAAIVQAANAQRSGGVRVSAPIELKVLQGDRVLGSSADGPIVTTAGTHQLEFINTALGFRASQAVTFRAGEITSLSVPVPAGRISINAQPWAEVWIDSRPVGETPLANLDIPVGEHEVVFRHPDLGVRRQSVIVRADSVARVSTTFDR